MAVAAMTTACTTAAPVPPPAPATTSSTPPPSLEELNKRARVALAPPDAFAAIGGKPERSSPANDDDMGGVGENVISVCGGGKLLVDSGLSVARSRVWTAGVNLFAQVHAMSELPASVLMISVQRRAENCVLNSEAGTVFAGVPLDTPPGVAQVYAYCEVNGPGEPPWTCFAALARGTLIEIVASSGQSKDSALAQLVDVVPTFAEHLVKA